MFDRMRFTAFLVGIGLFVLGCDDGTGTDDATTSSSSTSTGSTQMAQCTMPTAVPCEDDVILKMSLKVPAAPGAIMTSADGAGFRSIVDAKAGVSGADVTPKTSYVYAKFTDAGLEKVEIGDEDAIGSMDWDIAFRRYVVRINSGHSGPSCVSAARVPTKDGTFDELAKEPAELTFHTDEYFTDSCELIPDGSGLPGSPATALSSYWTYPGCVAMSDFVYVVKLADGRNVKLQVESFYSPAVQEQCDTKGSVPMSNTGSGTLQFRWAFL